MLRFPLSELDSSLLIHYQQENHYNQLRETSDAFCWSGSWCCPGAFSIFRHFSLSSRWHDETFHLPQFGVLDVLDCKSDFIVENRLPIIPIHLGMVAPCCSQPVLVRFGRVLMNRTWLIICTSPTIMAGMLRRNWRKLYDICVEKYKIKNHQIFWIIFLRSISIKNSKYFWDVIFI